MTPSPINAVFTVVLFSRFLCRCLFTVRQIIHLIKSLGFTGISVDSQDIFFKQVSIAASCVTGANSMVVFWMEWNGMEEVNWSFGYYTFDVRVLRSPITGLKTPTPARKSGLMWKARNDGLFTELAGSHGNTVRARPEHHSAQGWEGHHSGN